MRSKCSTIMTFDYILCNRPMIQVIYKFDQLIKIYIPGVDTGLICNDSITSIKRTLNRFAN